MNAKAYCRLCAQLKPNLKLRDLNNDANLCEEVREKLQRLNICVFTPYEENLPKTVCLICLGILDNAYKFAENVTNAQSVLIDIASVQIKKECYAHTDDELPDNDNFEGLSNIKVSVKKEHDANSATKTDNTMEGDHLPLKRKRKKKPIKKIEDLPLSDLKLTWDDYDWSCAFCETHFPNLEELKSHLMEYHETCNHYKCADCKGWKIHLDKFVIHARRHRRYLKLSCHICKAKFSKFNDCTANKHSHISEFMCPGCSTPFATKELLDEHVSRYFKKNRGLSTEQLAQFIDVDGVTCIECKKTFASRSGAAHHVLRHIKRERNHVCEICGKGFYDKNYLSEHVKHHDTNKSYVCKICNAGFSNARYLQNHIRVHDSSKPFSCDICGKCFRTRRSLRSHSIVHTDEIPFQCEYCDKKFKFKTILTQHTRLHTGVKPYSCQECQKNFSNWPNYNKHMKRKHDTDLAKRKYLFDAAFTPNQSVENRDAEVASSSYINL